MKYEYTIEFGNGAIIGLLIGIFISIILCIIFPPIHKPSAMDVYQGKTTLKYTIVDGIKTDSCVVFKNNYYETLDR